VALLVTAVVFAIDRYRFAAPAVTAALGESRKLTGELTEQRTELHRANQAWN
jgi:hypothetical protein